MTKFAVSTLLAFLLLATASWAGVVITSPAPGSSSGSPVHFVASASSSSSVIAMHIYVDNVSVFAVSSASLDTFVPMAAGSHSVVVQAWDSAGGIFKNAETISIAGGTGGTSGTVSGGVPSNAIVKSGIQAMTGWQNCSTCAGANGAGPVAGFSLLQFQQTPSINRQSAKFSLWGSTPYSDALWWKQLGGNNAATNFRYDLDFYTTAPQLAQSLEFDVNQSNGSKKFIFGTQCNLRGSGRWEVWDTANGAWRATAVPCPVPAANVWHHLTWEFQRNSGQTIFVAVTLDGQRHAVNQTYNARAVSASEVNVAFQMDGDFAQHAYSVWLDNVTLRYW